MTPRSRWIVRLFGLTGLGFSGAASWVHYRLLTDPTYISVCDINAAFNCSSLYLSRYGSVMGVPVAVGGVIWFALVSLLAWLGPAPASIDVERAASSKVERTTPGKAGAGRHKAAETAPVDPIAGYLFVLATIGLASILYLGFASYKMHTLCVLCLGTYVSVIGIFVTTGLSTTGRLGRLPVRLLEDVRHMTAKPVALIVSVLFVAGTAYATAFFPSHVDGQQAAPPAQPELSQDAEAQFRQAWAAQPRIDLGIPSDGAKVVVVKFNDWLCPSCKFMHQAYKPTLDKYAKESPGAVKYVIKDYLWNNRCNPFTQTIQGHEGSCEAAAAVRMARDRGKADAMIAWLFDNQERLGQSAMGASPALGASNASSTAIRAQAMTLLGITQSDFDRMYVLKLDDIKRDESDGNALNVHSTPMYFVNGVRTAPDGAGNLPAPYFDLAIKVEMTRK